MWPNITVTVERRPARCDASMISTQRATGSLLGLIRLRTPSCEHLGGGAGRGVQPGVAQAGEHLVAAAGPEMSHMCAISIGL